MAEQGHPAHLAPEILQVCRQKGVPTEDYPFNTVTKGFYPLQDWCKKVYQPSNLLAHVRKQHGTGAAVAAAFERGDGVQFPIPYTVWVIDEFKVDLDTAYRVADGTLGRRVRRAINVPGGHGAAHRQRAVRNIALASRAQASGADVIRLFRNAVMGQPAVEVVEASMKYEPGAGFLQNVFAQLKFAVPILVYLDNALAHLFNPLQTLLQRLYGGRRSRCARTAEGRPHIERDRASAEQVDPPVPGHDGHWPERDPCASRRKFRRATV